jgi:hypothetical protein
MNLRHFGDSYDIVKKSLLQWLSAFGPWAAHPMFTHVVTAAAAYSFSRFLGVDLVSTEVLDGACERRAYLAACGNCRSIFLDPDTGVRLRSTKGKRSTEFIFGDELVEIASARPHGLVLAFDQSLARGSEREQVQEKLDHFLDHAVEGFAYVSHASFLVLGQSGALVREARDRVLVASGLPLARIVTATPPGRTSRPTATAAP